MPRPPILFLDFDGVLNNDAFLRFQKNHVAQREHRLFDPENLRALDQLIDALSIASVVVTSSWRQERSVAELQELLRREGLRFANAISDVTVHLGRSLEARGEEISEWVERHQPERYIVLDDFELPSELAGAVYKVSASTGLTGALVEKITFDLHTG